MTLEAYCARLVVWCYEWCAINKKRWEYEQPPYGFPTLGGKILVMHTLHSMVSLCSGIWNIFRWKTHFPTEFSSNFPPNWRLWDVCGENKGNSHDMSLCYIQHSLYNRLCKGKISLGKFSCGKSTKISIWKCIISKKEFFPAKLLPSGAVIPVCLL